MKGTSFGGRHVPWSLRIAAIASAAALLLPASALAVAQKHVCGAAPTGVARCHSVVVTDANGQPNATAAPAGYGPADLRAAYSLPSTSGGAGQTIAIVDAYNDPNAEADLGVYRSQFGLGACTTANGCFRKVNQFGGTSYPKSNSSWSQEIALDVDMASAICPSCHILLVEARSASGADLYQAVDEAAALGATEISNSWGGNEYSGETADEAHFNHPGIAITVSSGDSGYRSFGYPAASRYVTAVGGTSLNRAANARGWTETAWSGSGSGCSLYIAKPSWQTDTGCAQRTVADVAAVADPNTGVAVYDTFHTGGWLVFGGTSVSSPILAGVYALAGNAASVNSGSYPYSHTASLFDVTMGSSGSCGGSYLCTAGVGFDGPTGLGTPDTAGAF